MLTNAVEIQGTLREDGTLVLDSKPNLPPGRVTVTVTVAPDYTQTEIWQFFERLWANQRATGHVSPTAEEVEEYLSDSRDDDERIHTIEQIQEEGRRQRQQQGPLDRP